MIIANDNYVIVHARISGNGRRRSWIIATILRIENGCVVGLTRTADYYGVGVILLAVTTLIIKFRPRLRT